ncbi:unnamed protein product [Microthlaspi erraticum]|uniref:Uncharacterized protein n=1 Tax=Microthlaspi erraticum TaxID=1685480 RepID=A0A6D2J3B2_9BRAS|nr:unnamed protein product [Microthlaspi erraticum]
MTKGKVNQESYTEGIKNLIWVRDLKHIKPTLLESEKDSSFEESMRICKSGSSKEDKNSKATRYEAVTKQRGTEEDPVVRERERDCEGQAKRRVIIKRDTVKLRALEEKEGKVSFCKKRKEIWRIWIGEKRMALVGFLRFISVRKDD